MDSSLGWLRERSVAAVRAALTSCLPEAADEPIVLKPWIETTNEWWAASTALVGERYVVKFAWSEVASARVWHEACLLRELARASPDLPAPPVIATGNDPVLLVTQHVAGEPLSFECVEAANAEYTWQLADQIAGYLARLHPLAEDPGLSALLEGVPPPEPQATTADLRARFGAFVNAKEFQLAATWCDWVDALSESVGARVLVHGDLHGYNQIWDLKVPTLRAVVDFQTGSLAEPEYDLRYLPGHGPRLDLFLDTAHAYERYTGRAISIERAMAWHVRTHLGDALWRSEAGVALPDGGTPSSWVAQLADRFEQLGIK